MRTPTEPHFEVRLDADHPGLHDQNYRRRRDQIARLARDHVSGTPPERVAYTDEENETWATIGSHLRPSLERHAAREVVESMARWAPWSAPIPQLADLSAPGGPLEATGFVFEPVHGLLSSRDFFAALRRGVFRSTQYMRHPSRPLYTPEPDLVHELVGHAGTFAIPGVAELSVAFGEAAAGADADQLAMLERLYWYSVEFGVVLEEGEPKAFGAGLLSSAGELGALPRTELRPFDPATVSNTVYVTDRVQPVLFAAGSLGELLGLTLEAVRAMP